MSNTLYLLARAEEAGFAEAAIQASSIFDPLLRRGLRTRARAAIERARAATTLDAKTVGEGHELRLAFLLEAGAAKGVDANDAGAVSAAYDVLKARVPARKRAFWPATTSVLGLACVAAAGVAAFMLWPNPEQRFLRSPLGVALGEPLTDYVSGAARRDGKRIEKGRASILSNGVRAQVGDDGYSELNEILDQTYALAGASGDEGRDRTTKLNGLVVKFNGQLVDRKVPAFLDTYVTESGDTGGCNVWLLSYYTEQKAEDRVAGKPFLVYWGRRLDTLNLQENATVHSSAAIGATVVPLDELDGWVVGNLIPVLAKNKLFGFGAPAPSDDLSSLGRVQKRAGELIRDEVFQVSEMSADDGTTLADLFVQRHDAFQRLKQLGDEFYEPRGPVVSARLEKILQRRSDEVDAKEILKINERLSRSEYVRAFARIVNAQARLEERYFVFWQSYDPPPSLVAAEVEAFAAPADVGAVRVRIASRLAMLAGADPLAFTALAEVAIEVAHDDAMALVFYEIEKELGMSPAWMHRSFGRDEEDFNAAYLELMKHPAVDVQRAAEGAYAKLFGAPLPKLERRAL